MTSRRAADDRSGRGTPCRALTNWSVARGESETNQLMAEVILRIFIPTVQFPCTLNCAARRMLRGRSQDSLCRPGLVLGIYKYVLCTHVQDQPAMRDFRAVILLIRRIWARYNSRRIMRVSAPRRIASSVNWRVFFLSICFSDCSRCHDRVACSSINCIPPLRVQTRAQHKQPSYNC
jgi:hypothetical protein